MSDKLKEYQKAYSNNRSGSELKKLDEAKSISDKVSLESAIQPYKEQNGLVNFGKYGYNKILQGTGSAINGLIDFGLQVAQNTPVGLGSVNEGTILDYRNNIAPKVKDGLKEYIGADLDKGQERKFDEGFVSGAVGGVLYSLPAMVTPYGIGLYSQAYDSGLESINRTEAGRNLTETQKTLYAGSLGAVIGKLEKLGLDKIMGGAGAKVANTILLDAFDSLAKKGVKKITQEVLETELNQITKSLSKRLVRGAEGAVDAVTHGVKVEGTTGGLQELGTVGLERLTNYLTDEKVFDEESMGELAGRVLKSAGQEAIGGALMGGAIGGVKGFNSGVNAELVKRISNATSFDEQRNVLLDIEQIAQEQGMDEQAVSELVNRANELIEINKTLPKELSAEEKATVIPIVEERNALQEEIDKKTEEIKTVDEAFKKEEQAKIDLLEERKNKLNDFISDPSTSEDIEEQPTTETAEVNKQNDMVADTTVETVEPTVAVSEEVGKAEDTNIAESVSNELDIIDKDVFKEENGLSKIGTRKKYKEYIDSVFPESKLNKIVYRVGDVYESKQPIYFTDNKDYALGLSSNKNINAYVLDIKNPLFSDKPFYDIDAGDKFNEKYNIKKSDRVAGYFRKDLANPNDYVNSENDSLIGKDVGQKEGQTYVVFDPKNVYKLGSENDIENFKDFIDKNKKTKNEQGTTIKETKETAQPIEKPTTKEQVGNAEDTTAVESLDKKIGNKFKAKDNKEYSIDIYDAENGKVESIDQRKRKDRLSLSVIDENGNAVADVSFWKQKDGTWVSNNTNVREGFKRKGIASAMYNFAKENGFEVKPSEIQTDEGKLFSEAINKKPTKLQTAKEKLAEKRKALKDLDINLSVSADPKQKAKALYEYHSALVDVAKEYINEGIKTVEDFAKEIGEKVSKTVKDAWEEANGGDKLKESDFEQQVKPKEPKSSDEFTKLTHKSLQNEEIRNTLSNVERETGTELSDEQKEYQRTNLIEALHSGEDMIDASKEEFGDDYVGKTLNFLKDNRNTLPAENEALLYVSLENDLQRQLEYDPENVTIKKQLDLVRNESLKRFRSFAIATGFGRLRQIARFGFDVDAYANSLLTSAERGDRKKVSQAVEATPDEINQIAEERESFTITEPTVKRNKKVVRQEIDEVLRQLRKDLIKSARGASGLMSSLPLADQIKAVTPHVIKLSKLLAELGSMKAKEIISEIRKSIEDVAPDIKDSDIKDILTAKPTAKDNLERMKDNAKARIETLKQQIEDKKRELKITNKTKPDAELKSLLEQEKELKKIANEYLTPESLKRIDESKQKAIISKLENDIKELDKQIAEGQKKPMAERTPLENYKIAELKGVKKAKQDVLEDLDPNPREFTKQALIDAGYGRKIKVDGEERETLDWKLLAGEEGSIDNIREKVEQSLEKSGFTQAKISRMKDAFESEYNRLRADVIEKSLNELNRRNTPNEPVNSRSYSERLAELYNLGLFENQSDGYDYLINKAVGLSDASQESFFRAKELAKSLSELYKSTDINGKKMTEMQLKEAVRNVNDEFTKLMNSISWKDSNIAFKVMTVLQETMGLGQRFILGTAKQAIENPLSGYVERAYQKAGSIFDGYNPKELRRHNREMARVLFKDNSLNASLPYGEITTPFITRTRTEEWVNGLSDSQAYHAMMTTFMGRSFLESADSMHKIALTEKYFQNNVIKLLTNKTYEGRMTKQEALRFVTEKLTGQKFEEAQKSAEKIINDINESAGKKILPNNREAILRFANDITKLSLLEGTNLTEKELTASFKSAYRVAGLGLGHEANNFLSNMLSTQNERIERKLKKAVQEKQWWKASAYTGASILSKNILNPFVGGGTNWVVLTAEKAGLNPFNMVYNAMQAKESNLDLSTEQGLREVERVMFDQLRFKTSASRYFTGAMASLITYGAIKAFQGTDDGEDKLKELSEWLNKKENKWVAKYFNVMSPSMLIAYMYMLDDNLGGYFKNLFNVRTDTYSDANQLLDAGQTMLSSNRKVEKDKAWGQLGSVIGGKLQAPAPWRLTRDGLQVIQAIKGKPVYQADYTKPNTFASGFFMGGMLDFLGWKPHNDISEDFRELKIHNAETGKYDIYELTDKQKSEFIKYRNDFAKSPQFKLLQKGYEDYKKSNKDAKMDIEKELNKILNTYAKSMFLDEKTTFDEEGKITNIKKVK